jgi:hypothetical protein
MTAEREEIAASDRRGLRLKHGIVGRIYDAGGSHELLPLRVRPPCADIETVGAQLVEDGRVPLEIHFGDPIVGDGQRPRARIADVTGPTLTLDLKDAVVSEKSIDPSAVASLVSRRPVPGWSAKAGLVGSAEH